MKNVDALKYTFLKRVSWESSYFLAWKSLYALLCDQLNVQFSSVAQLCPTFCDPIDCSTPGFPVHHRLPELAQTHVQQVSDVIQPSHPLSSPSPAFNLAQHQGLFHWVSSLHQAAIKYWGFSFTISPSNEYSVLISFRMDWLDLLAVQGTLESSNTTVQKHQFFGTQLSL